MRKGPPIKPEKGRRIDAMPVTAIAMALLVAIIVVACYLMVGSSG